MYYSQRILDLVEDILHATDLCDGYGDFLGWAEDSKAVSSILNHTEASHKLVQGLGSEAVDQNLVDVIESNVDRMQQIASRMEDCYSG